MGAQVRRQVGGLDVGVDFDRGRHGGAPRLLGDEGEERGVGARPVVDEGRGLGAVGAHGLHAAALVEPRDLALRHHDRRDRGRVEGLVLARVVDGGGQGQEWGDPAPAGGGLDAAGPLDGGGGENSDPEAAVRSEGFLQGEVVGVDLGEVDRRGACDGGAVDEGERSRGVDAVDGGGHAG